MDEPTPSVHERILAAARRLFLAKGYNGSNLRDIAREAQVSMGGIYHHFDSKEDIYKALLEDREMATELLGILTLLRAPEFPENLPRIGAAIFELARKKKDFFKLVYIDVLEFQGRNVMQGARRLKDTMSGQARTLLGPRLAAGELVDAHPVVIMRCITDLFLYYYLEEVMMERSLAEDLGMTDEQVAEQMARILLHGILKPAES